MEFYRPAYGRPPGKPIVRKTFQTISRRRENIQLTAAAARAANALARTGENVILPRHKRLPLGKLSWNARQFVVP
jgi:hypothetical protein